MRIAYLAPELPGLTGTFVYKEVFALEDLGAEILTFSVHDNLSSSAEPRLNKMISNTEVLYRRTSKRLVKDNFKVLFSSPFAYIYCLFLSIHDAMLNVQQPRVALGILFRFVVAASMSKDCVAAKVQHIHAHFAHFPCDIAMYTSRLTNIPFSFTAHANDIFDNFWLLKQKTHRASFVATISQSNIAYLRSKGCSTENIHLIRCGVNQNDFPTCEKRYNGATLRLGFLGRLVEKKGVDILLRACKNLKESGVDFQLDILGDGPLKNDLQRLSNDLGLQYEVRFSGHVENSEVFSWLSSIDIFILPAIRDRLGDMDGIPVALIEAMLCETVVVSTSLSGIPELVKNDETGLLAKPGDPATLAICIERLALDPNLRTKLSMKAKEYVSHEFNSDVNARRLFSLLVGCDINDHTVVKLNISATTHD